MRHPVNTLTAISTLTILSACSGSDPDTPAPIEPTPIEITQAPEINPPQIFSGPLASSSEVTPGRFIRNGLYYKTVAPTFESTAPSPVTDSGRGFSDSFDGFSTTTTQEADVDEADRIEFDGETFYVASYPIWLFEEEGAFVRVLSKQQDGSLTSLGDIEVGTGENIQGMYLNAPMNDHLSVITASTQYFPIDILFASSIFIPNEATTTIEIFDVGDPQSPVVDTRISIGGHLLASRRIDQTLYVTTTFSPPLPEVERGATTDEQKLANYLAVLNVPDSDILPTVTKDGEVQTLYQANDCFIPTNATAEDGFSHTIQVLKIDLSAGNALEAVCAVTSADFLYMSAESLYLAGRVENATQLHKISLGEDFTVAASGEVTGTAGWRNPHLRMSEKDDYLRFVSSDYESDPSNPFHRLYVIEQQGNQLQTVATVPDMQAEQGLGKPGEDVYAVRFVGDKGYVVTFERIDPLYVLDLSEPLAPAIVGELEIPGFSSYLQPIGNDFLLGVGQQVDIENLPENGQPVIDILPVTTQMKVSLFDVRDPQTPQELSALVVPGAYTPVEYDYRALSVLVDDDYARFAMPIEIWDWNADEFTSHYTNQLLVLDVDRAAAEPDLTLQATIEPKNNEIGHYIYSGDDRSVLVGNDVYYLRGNQLWHSAQADETVLHGPY